MERFTASESLGSGMAQEETPSKGAQKETSARSRDTHPETLAEPKTQVRDKSSDVETVAVLDKILEVVNLLLKEVSDFFKYYYICM